jgi:hypothetical protein
MCGYRRINATLARHQAIISHKIVQWRATADEKGHYCFAVALLRLTVAVFPIPRGVVRLPFDSDRFDQSPDRSDGPETDYAAEIFFTVVSACSASQFANNSTLRSPIKSAGHWAT